MSSGAGVNSMTRLWWWGGAQLEAVRLFFRTPVASIYIGAPWAADACAADSYCREAEIAYEKKKKHSSPEAVKTFIIITNLQASTEPAGARCQAGSSAPRLSTFHHSALGGCKDLFYAGRKKKKKKKLIYWLVYCHCAFPQDWKMGWGVCLCVCVWAALHAGEKTQTIYVRVCVLSVPVFFGKQTGINFFVLLPKRTSAKRWCLCSPLRGCRRTGGRDEGGWICFCGVRAGVCRRYEGKNHPSAHTGET